MGDYGNFWEYVERTLDRPVLNLEMASDKFWKELKEKARPDFLEVCREITDE